MNYGYTDFVRADVEDDDSELILYYAKQNIDLGGYLWQKK